MSNGGESLLDVKMYCEIFRAVYESRVDKTEVVYLIKYELTTLIHIKLLHGRIPSEWRINTAILLFKYQETKRYNYGNDSNIR